MICPSLEDLSDWEFPAGLVGTSFEFSQSCVFIFGYLIVRTMCGVRFPSSERGFHGNNYCKRFTTQVHPASFPPLHDLICSGTRMTRSYQKHDMLESTQHTRFAHIWNEIVEAMREEDIISNSEREQVLEMVFVVLQRGKD